MSVTAMPQTTATPAEAEEEAGGGKKKKILILLVLVLVLGGAGYWFVLKPKGAEPAEPVAGEVLALDPIQVNLAGEHYLRIGVALQLTAEVHEEVDGSKALDATIEEFSGKDIGEVNNPEKRAEFKSHLLEELEHLYHDEVMGVYFTEFVTQ